MIVNTEILIILVPELQGEPEEIATEKCRIAAKKVTLMNIICSRKFYEG